MKVSEDIKKVSVVSVTAAVVIFLIWFAGPKLLRACGYAFALLSPVIMGYIFSLLINPFADKLQKKLKIPRVISVIAVIIIVLVVIGGAVSGIVYNIVGEVKSLANNWPDLVGYIKNSWDNLLVQWNGIYGTFPDFMQTALNRLGTNVYLQALELMSDAEVLGGAQNVVKSLPAGIIWTIIFVLSMFFSVTQKQSVNGFLCRLLGERAVNRIKEVKNECKRFLWGYIKAQIILMVIVFFIILIPLAMFNNQYAVLISLLTAFLDALPFFGSGFVLWPLSIIAFITGNISMGIVYVVIYLMIMLMRRFLEPKLVSDHMGLHPVVTLATMYVGYCRWGLIGLITGPILFMLILSVYKVGIFDGIIKVLKRLFDFAKREIKLFADYLDKITK